MKKKIIFLLSLIMIFTAIPVSAASPQKAPTIKLSYSAKTVHSAKKNYVTGKISAANGQRVVLYNEKGKAISLQRMGNNGLAQSFKLPAPELKKGKNIFVVRSESIGDIPASNAAIITFNYKKSAKKSSSSSSASLNGWTGKSSNGKCYLGNAASPKNMSQSGDQDGKEVLVSKCGGSWDYVIRWNDKSKALAAAKIMYDSCKNDHVGYNNTNKAKSTSYYKQLKACKGNATAITENCDTACSQMVASIVRVLGEDIKVYVNSEGLWKELRNRDGFTVYSSKSYTQSTKNLLPGDILIRAHGNNHSAMVVQTKNGMSN